VDGVVTDDSGGTSDPSVAGGPAGTAVARAARVRATSFVSSVLLVLGLGLAGCMAEAGSDEDVEAVDDHALDSANLPLRFLPGELFVPSAVIQSEVRKVFRTEAELEAALQMDNPGIDFTREWAVFYAPGSTNPALTPGARARIDFVSLSSTGLTLKVTTALEQNGTNCPTRRTRPFLLVAIPIPDHPPAYTRFYRADRTRVCSADAYYDGVPFTAEQAAGALSACNVATPLQLSGAGVTGAQQSIITGGRTWPSLIAVANTLNIGPATMEKLRALSSAF
jgi:hypothetical protein